MLGNRNHDMCISWEMFTVRRKFSQKNQQNKPVRWKVYPQDQWLTHPNSNPGSTEPGPGQRLPRQEGSSVHACPRPPPLDQTELSHKLKDQIAHSFVFCLQNTGAPGKRTSIQVTGPRPRTQCSRTRTRTGTLMQKGAPQHCPRGILQRMRKAE